MAGLLTDLRSAWRLMSRSRSTSALILVTFALGLGANAAIFAIARGVVLRPLPYHDPERLVMIWAAREPRRPDATGRGLATSRWFRAIDARQRSFAAVAALESWNGSQGAVFDAPSAAGAERLRGAFVTLNFFDTLGVAAREGRTFAADDPLDVAIISHELWQSRFGGAHVIGHRLELATGRGDARVLRPLTIIGVLPPRVQFSYPESTDVWLPLPRQDLDDARFLDAIRYRLVARLQPDVPIEQAQSELASIKDAMAAEIQRDYSRTTWWLEPIHETATGAARPTVRLLSGIAFLVLLVACLNVAALLLAQTVERRRALAVHVALGASRWRVIRQLLTESAFMAILAATASVAAVAALQPLLRAAMPAAIPRVAEIGVDVITVGWMAALVAVSVILATIVPAWRGSAIDPGLELAQTGRSSTPSPSAALWRQSLVTAQVALVVVQLVAGGLLLHSFWKLQQVDLGFDGDRVFTAEMRLIDPRYFDPVRLRAFQDELLTRVRALPGVERASITSAVPLRGVDWTTVLTVDGRSATAKRRDIDPDYFDVMGIPLIAGRRFSSADTTASTRVTIISRSLADQLFPGDTALGRTIPWNKQQLEVIGIAGDVRNVRIERAGDPAYYVPRAQESSELICLVVRTTPDAPDLAAAIRSIVASIDPLQPVFNATTLDWVVSETIADRRFYAVATTAFAIVTLLLTAAGLYGVTAYAIHARTREIGVRVALGAEPKRLVRLLTIQSVRPVFVGVALGLIGAFWASRLLEGFLFEIHGFDPLAYAGAALWVLALTLVAASRPAARAARTSPLVTLRHE